MAPVAQSKLTTRRSSPRFQQSNMSEISTEAPTRKRQNMNMGNEKKDGTKDKRNKTSSDDIDEMPLQWRTPDLPVGFFVSSSRFKYSPNPEDVYYPPSGGPPISSHIQHVREIAASRPPMVRAAVGASRPPMVRAAVGASRPPAGVSGSGHTGSHRPSKTHEFKPPHPTSKRPASAACLPPKKQNHTMQPIKEEPEEEHVCDPHGPEQHEEREGRKAKQQQKNMRDPLLHKPLVTPPPPVLPGQNETPPEIRRYTHSADLPTYLLPTLKQRFDSFAEAKDFYNRYARHCGFGIKVGQHNGNNRYLKCSREGKHRTYVHEAERKRTNNTRRCGYKARLRLKEKRDGSCVIEDIDFEHNHTLLISPSMVVFLHSHKTFDPALLEYVKFLQFLNLRHAQIMSIISSSVGGSRYMTMHGRDLINMKAKNSREDDVDDVLKLLAFFTEMKAANDEFFFEIQIDEGDSIKNIFWANANCRGSYEDFGDCITLDTTYKTNSSKMPLGVFVGVNHHLQTTIFACALIRDETEESFVWLFNTFLSCINGKQPIMILTDECPSMLPAIPRVFFLTLHKLCRWHMLKKYKEPLGTLYKMYSSFKVEFRSILNWPLMPSEFEAAWHQLVQKYQLQNNTVMIQLWEGRKEWISAYFKNVFYARMTSTQRSESMNYILKKSFLKPELNLHRFVEQDETETRTHYGFERQMIKNYTKAVYNDFRMQQKKSTLYLIREDPDLLIPNYLVRFANPQIEFSWSHHEFRVHTDPVGGKFECECMCWEHTGLFCTHVIAMLEHLRVTRLPTEYILKRYNRGATMTHTFNREDYKKVASHGSSIAYQHNENLQLCFKLVRTTKSDEQRAVAKHGLIALIDRVEAVGCSTAGTAEEGEEIPEFSQYEPDMNKIFADNDQRRHELPKRVILPPPISKTKGSGKQTKGTEGKTNKAANHGKKAADKVEDLPVTDGNGEIIEIGKRRCSVCGEKKRHNARSCPVLKSRLAYPGAASNSVAGTNGKKDRDDRAAPKKIVAGRPDDAPTGKRKRGRICGGCGG